MTTFEVREARIHHCGQMARLLRAEHRRAVLGLGLNVHQEIRARFEESHVRRIWLIDGRLSGLGGVSGPMLSSVGFIWLALAEHATKFPIAIAKEAFRQIDEALIVQRSLVTTILDGDTTSRRFAEFLGFRAVTECKLGNSSADVMEYQEAA